MTPTPPRAAPRGTSRRLPQFVRWLHLYSSLLGLAATLLFAVTGLTLNHAEWFEAGEPVRRELRGELAPALLAHEVDRLSVAEQVRASHGLRGTVTDFVVDADRCTVVWKGPAYSADVEVDRHTGHYAGEEQQRGLVALLNDLHKGRDTGPLWAVAIDAAAVVLTLISATGLWLLLYLKKRVRTGLLVGLAGAFLTAAAYVLGVT